MDKNYSTDTCHELYFERNKPILGFDETKDYNEWKRQVRLKLTALLGSTPEKTEPNLRILSDKKCGTHRDISFLFTTEEACDVPCRLWIPNNAKKPCPVIICLQGHSSGAHISMGKVRYPGDEKSAFSGDRNFAQQIIEFGYAALILEQHAFGQVRCRFCA